MPALAAAPSKASTRAEMASWPSRLDRDLTLSASTSSTMACRFISVASAAIGLPSSIAKPVAFLSVVTFPHHGQRQCPTADLAGLVGYTATGLVHSLDD